MRCVITAVLSSMAFLILSQYAVAEIETVEPDKQIIVLPDANEPVRESTYPVAVDSHVVVHVYFDMTDSDTVKAEVGPKESFQAVQFRNVVEMSQDGKPLLTGRGHAVLVVEVKKTGSGSIKVKAGRESYGYMLEAK